MPKIVLHTAPMTHPLPHHLVAYIERHHQITARAAEHEHAELARRAARDAAG